MTLLLIMVNHIMFYAGKVAILGRKGRRLRFWNYL